MVSSYLLSVCSTAFGEWAVHITVQLHVTEHIAAWYLMAHSRRAQLIDVLDGSASESMLFSRTRRLRAVEYASDGAMRRGAVDYKVELTAWQRGTTVL